MGAADSGRQHDDLMMGMSAWAIDALALLCMWAGPLSVVSSRRRAFLLHRRTSVSWPWRGRSACNEERGTRSATADTVECSVASGPWEPLSCST